MERTIAFLRAINIGGHTVKMETLRQLFVGMGFERVETFIASGNVVFECDGQEARALEKQIETGLRQGLGYEVPTFVRTCPELAAIAAYQPFAPADLEAAAAFNIAFMGQALGDHDWQKLLALRTEIDDFRTHGCEVYWLCRKRQSESTFSNAVLEKTLGRPSTLRGANTLKRMVAQYCSG
jgi:uncharacterized protein (DUF1697 family)